ncbi:MAG: nitroreductase family protein [Spirochaetota bacterium]
MEVVAVEFYETVRKRFSVRSFENKPVEPEKLERILEAARLAPSAKNLQQCRYVVVTDKEKIEQLAQASYNQTFVGEAAAVIVCCSDTDKATMRCGHAHYTIDVGIALEHAALAAVAEGLGGCWIGSFKPEEVRKILGIPDSIEVVELYPLGYPAADAKPLKTKKPLEEIVSYNAWSL